MGHPVEKSYSLFKTSYNSESVCDVPVRTGYGSSLKTRFTVALFGAAAQMLVETMIPLKSYTVFENKCNL